MSTYGELQERISRDLFDEDNQTFPVQVVKDMIAASFAEIGRWFPERFQEDIEPIADTYSYPLRSTEFPDGIDDIEVQRVEIWDGSSIPAKPVQWVVPQSQHPEGLSYSQAGWIVWAGTLELPPRVVDFLDPDTHLIRVWGYSPWPLPVEDADVIPFGAEKEEFVSLLCNIEGLRRITSSRVEFKQWQTRSNNTDITMASLLSDLNIAKEEWRLKQRSAQVLREAP